VAELRGHLADLIDQHGRIETTLTGLRRTRAWGHADLVTSAGDTGDEYVARISLGIRGPTTAAIESRLARTA
jgi:hypothetical protein